MSEQNDDANATERTYFDELRATMDRQFRWLVGLFAVVGIAGLVALAGGLFLQAPRNADIVAALDRSTDSSGELIEAMASSRSDSTWNRAVNALERASEAQREATRAYERRETGISPEGLTLIQVIGGAAVVAVLGFLGLQRLQTYDSEISEARKELNLVISETRKDIRAGLTSQVRSTVSAETERRFDETREQMDRITKEFRAATDEQQSQFQVSVTGAQDEIQGVVQNIEGLLHRYSWLDREDVREVADSFHEVAGVEEAAEVATRFRIAGDKPSAKLVLKRIGEHDLPGDSDDFHNAHSEAMRMDDPLLGVEIADVGLGHFPEHYDLMADKAIGLIGLGRADEAKNMLDQWRKDSPEEFARGWRPVVFYARAVQSGQLTPEIIASLEEALGDVASRLPTEVKVWSTYGRFERDLGRHERAEEILRRGCDLNRYSQELNYVLGELLLQMGRAEEALPVLESGLAMDYQDQYQHDVNQHAVRTTLAQAYEAVGNTERAELLYRSVLKAGPTEAGHSISQYAMSRLAAISIMKGELPEEEETSQFGDVGDIMNFVNQLRKHETGSEEEAGDIDDIVDV